MDKTYSLSSPMVVGSLDVKMTHFVIVKKMKNYLVLKYYILALLVHLYILPIVHIQTLLFSVNLLVRYSFTPTRRHWNGIKHILRYLWVYFTQGNQSNNCLDMQIKNIFQIYTKVSHKHAMCLIIVILLSYGDLSNKQW